MIHLITRISVVGICIITAALVVLLSAFNGIEAMIEKLYSDFDPDLTIHATKGKTFPGEMIALDEIRKIPGVTQISRAIEEVVVLKHEKKWVNATLLAVDSSFLSMSKLKLKNSEGNYTHLVDGAPVLSKQQMHFGIIGATLLDKLGGYIPEKSEYEQIIIYAPKREIKMNFGSNPFNSQWLPISGRMNYNREVNAEKLVVPLSLGADLLGYDTDLTAVFVAIAPAFSAEEIKQRLSKVLGPDFKINTRYEKNELIFKTSKSEKLMVIIILLFIFVLAAFNLVASLTMLFIEKKDNVSTMISFGADRHFVFRIFLTEGLLICAKGIFFGLLLGYFICAIQRYGTPIEMPNTGGEPFPIVCSWKDGLIILMLVSVLSFIFSFWPVKYLIKRNFGNLKY